MQQKDYFFEELQNQFTEADFSFRTGQTTARDFSEISLEIYGKILSVYESLEPVAKLREAAQLHWDQAAAFGRLAIIPKTLCRDSGPLIEDLRNRFLQTETQFRLKKLQISTRQKALADVMIKLLDRVGQIEPYLSEFQEAASKQLATKQ